MKSNSSSQINCTPKDSLSTSTLPKSPAKSIESAFNEQSNENINSYVYINSDNEMGDQNDLDLILSNSNINGENLTEIDQRTNSQLLEDNKKLVTENLRLRNLLSEMKKSQNSSTIDSLKSKINELNLQLENVTNERDELKAKVAKLSEDLIKIKDPQKKTSLQNDTRDDNNNNDDDNYDSNEHLININKINGINDVKMHTVVKDSEVLDALGLIENMITSQSNDISFVSNQRNALFEAANKLIESNKELENQLIESIEYASELEKNHIDLEQKCIELQDKSDIEIDFILTSIINTFSSYKNSKRNSKKSSLTHASIIIDTFNKKVQQKLSQIQDQTLSSQIIELFKLTLVNFYDTVDDLARSFSPTQTSVSSLYFNPNGTQKYHTKKELALLGHLENAIRYISEVTKSSKISLREDERTYIIAQISRISNFIEEEVDVEKLSIYASLFSHTSIESQILAFYDFINKENEEEDSEYDNKLNEEEEEEENKNKNNEEEDEEEDKLLLIQKKEFSCEMIKSTPVRELYNLFKSVVVVNSIMFDHFDRVAEEIVQLKSELSSMKENKCKYEQQYNRISERVDEMSSELGRFFFSIQQQKKLSKGTKNGKNKKTKNAKKINNDTATEIIQSSNACADDPFLAVSQLIYLYSQLKEENAKQKKIIKNLNKTVNVLSKKDEISNQIKDLEAQNLQLVNENNELKEKSTNINEMSEENAHLKNEVAEALKKVEILQIKANKMKEKKKEEEDKIANLTQKLQLSESHNHELKSQFDNLKEIAAKSTSIIKSYKEKEKRFVNRIISLESVISQSEINENTKQREINEAKKLQMLQSKHNEETKEKYETQIKQLNDELQNALSRITKMEEEASTVSKSKENLLREVAKLKLVEKTLEMKLKQQEIHSLSIVNIERGKCESKILMAKSQIEDCLSEHEKRLAKIKLQILQIVREFFPESYTAAVRSASLAPSISSTETTLNNVFNKSPNKNSVSEISNTGNHFSPSLLDYTSSSKNANFTSPHAPSNQSETSNVKMPIYSLLSPPNQQQTQQTQSPMSPNQYSSPATVFTSLSNQVDSRPFASLEILCDSVEASLDSVRLCVSRSDFHNNASTVQEANKVRAQLGMKSSGSLLKKFSEMNDKIDELEETQKLYKEKYNKCMNEKNRLERELQKNELIRTELGKWEKWSKALFRQLNNDVSFTSLSKSSGIGIGDTDLENSSSMAAILNDSDDSDVLELKDLTTGGKKRSPFKVIPLISSDEIRAALEESVLASIGHRAMLRKISVLRVEKRVIDRAYQGLFELIRPIVISSPSNKKSKGKAQVKASSSSSSAAALALRKLKKNFNYFFCFMLNSNVRFSELNEDPPNTEYAACSIRHLILIYVFLKRIEKYSGFVAVVGSNSLSISKENEIRSSLIEFD